MKVFLTATSFLESYGGPAFSVPRLGLALANAGLTIGLWAPDGSAVRTKMIPKDHPRITCLAGSLEEGLTSFGRPTLLHDNGIWMPHNRALARLAALRRIPRIVSPRGMLEPWALQHKWLKKRIAWMLYQRGDLMRAALIHATAEQEAQHIKDLRLKMAVAIIANGVDLPSTSSMPTATHHRGSEGGSRIALFLSRIHPKKGLPMLVEAWKRIQPAGWMLHIAGPDEGGHLPEVKRAVTAADLMIMSAFSGPSKARIVKRPTKRPIFSFCRHTQKISAWSSLKLWHMNYPF